MRKRDSDHYFSARAITLAETGECRSMHELSRKLWDEGCTNADELLAPSFIRDDLYLLFARAKRGPSETGER